MKCLNIFSAVTLLSLSTSNALAANERLAFEVDGGNYIMAPASCEQGALVVTTEDQSSPYIWWRYDEDTSLIESVGCPGMVMDAQTFEDVRLLPRPNWPPSRAQFHIFDDPDRNVAIGTANGSVHEIASHRCVRTRLYLTPNDTVGIGGVDGQIQPIPENLLPTIQWKVYTSEIPCFMETFSCTDEGDNFFSLPIDLEANIRYIFEGSEDEGGYIYLGLLSKCA